MRYNKLKCRRKDTTIPHRFIINLRWGPDNSHNDWIPHMNSYDPKHNYRRKTKCRQSEN